MLYIFEIEITNDSSGYINGQILKIPFFAEENVIVTDELGAEWITPLDQFSDHYCGSEFPCYKVIDYVFCDEDMFKPVPNDEIHNSIL